MSKKSGGSKRRTQESMSTKDDPCTPPLPLRRVTNNLKSELLHGANLSEVARAFADFWRAVDKDLGPKADTSILTSPELGDGAYRLIAAILFKVSQHLPISDTAGVIHAIRALDGSAEAVVRGKAHGLLCEWERETLP